MVHRQYERRLQIANAVLNWGKVNDNVNLLGKKRFKWNAF